MNKKKFIILDGNSLLFRAFYAMPPLKTKKGQYTNAVYGFLSMLYKLIDNYKPDYICTAFDPKKPTFRHEQYKEYKAGRAKAPNELISQFGLIREVLDIHEIKHIEIDGFEADDVAGTLALLAKDQDMEVFLVTSDKDYLQLVSEDVNVLLTKKGVTNIVKMDYQKIVDDYGITPEQFVDLKALMGDSSDNIPGVMGVGEKTALKLIKEYKDIDNLYNNIENIKGKLKEKLEADKMQAYMSRTLGQIVTNIPIDDNFEEYKYAEPKGDKLLDLYNELEFRNFKKRIKTEKKQTDENRQITFDMTSNTKNKNEDEEQIEQKIEVRKIDLEYVDSIEQIEKVIEEIKKNKKTAVKFLLDGDRTLYSNPIALGITSGKNITYYIDFEKIDIKDVMILLKDIFEDVDIEKIGHHLKNEIITLMKYSIEFNGITFDSMIAKYLLNPSETSYRIDKLAYEYLEIDIPSENDLLGTGKKRLSFKDIDLEKRKEYLLNCLNCVINIEDILIEKIKELKMDKLYNEIEIPLITVLASMEFLGFKIDTDVLEKIGHNLEEKLEILEQVIYEHAEEKFNINSPKQLGVILFEKLELPVVKKTKTGYSTNIEVLEKLRTKHPIINKIIEYRQLMKLKSTYVDGLFNVIDTETKKVHSSFNQTITTTGRISSTEPNLQNIPTRTDEGRELRKVFTAENEDYILIDADYSQIELRVLAHLSNDENLITAFKNNEDIHTKTASEVFKVKQEEVTSLMRSRAKAVNFGIVYGISDYGLGRDLSIPRKEAKVYIENYLAYYQKVDDYMKDIIKRGKKDGYVETYFQRRRYIPELESRNFNIRSFGERIALNTPVQGTAADIIKKAMVNVYNKLKEQKMKSRLILQIHDELIIEAHTSEIKEVQKLLKEEMENVVDLKVHLDIDMNTGASWYEAK